MFQSSFNQTPCLKFSTKGPLTLKDLQQLEPSRSECDFGYCYGIFAQIYNVSCTCTYGAVLTVQTPREQELYILLYYQDTCTCNYT